VYGITESTKQHELEFPQGDERLFALLLDSSPNPMLVINPDTTIRYVNAAFQKETGFSSAELIGRKSPYPWWTRNLSEAFFTSIEKLLSTGVGIFNQERLFQKKNKERFWVQLNTALVNSGDEPKYLLSTWVNITKRKEMESIARTLLNASNNSAIMIDINGIILDINTIGARRFGHKINELIDTSIFELIPPVQVQLYKMKINKVISTDKRVRFEETCNGLVFSTAINPVTDIQGNVMQLAIYSEDITERTKAEEKVRKVFKDLILAVRASVPMIEHISSAALTPREESVVQLIADGKSTKEIALVLDLSIKTVETHRNRIMNKLGLTSLAELIKYAIREGFTGI